MPKKKTKKKKWTGQRTAKKTRPKLVGDSYQANEKDLARLRKIAEDWGRSKAELVRYGVTLVLKVFRALRLGETELVVDLSEFYETDAA